MQEQQVNGEVTQAKVRLHLIFVDIRAGELECSLSPNGYKGWEEEAII